MTEPAWTSWIDELGSSPLADYLKQSVWVVAEGTDPFVFVVFETTVLVILARSLETETSAEFQEIVRELRHELDEE